MDRIETHLGRKSQELGMRWLPALALAAALCACGKSSCPAGSVDIDGRCELADGRDGGTGENMSPIGTEGGSGSLGPQAGAGGGLSQAGSGGNDSSGGGRGGNGGPTDGGACADGFVPAENDCVRDRCIGLPDEPAACGEHGTCSDGTSETPTCECDPGYLLEDGVCVRNPCEALDDEPAACDPNADCSYEGAGEVTCTCREGYQGDGTSCTADACMPAEGEDPPCGANQNCELAEGGDVTCVCEPLTGDCDGDPENGCEAMTAADPNHCGECGRACATGLSCEEGECGVRATAIVPGFGATLVLLPGGAVLGSGTGLLYGRTGNSTTFVPLSLDPAGAISMSVSHACLLGPDGNGAACWGVNHRGTLGVADPDATYAELPVAGARALAAGDYHSCVVDSEGFAYCWGAGVRGEFGDGTDRNNDFAGRTYADAIGGGFRVRNVEDAIDVHAGNTINCALRSNGLVYCWGTDAGAAYSADLVRDSDGGPLNGARSICVGQRHGCALLVDETVVCWGQNDVGQLGEENPTGRNRYVPVALPNDVVDLTCGGFHTCVVLEDGQAYCWGQNAAGQLGSGDVQSSRTPLPVLTSGLGRVRSIHSGPSSASTCMQVETGAVYCWGYNYYGHLGLGDTRQSAAPVEVTAWP